MSGYEHFQEARRAEDLPEVDKTGPCLTCRFWEVDGERNQETVPQIARCVQPQLQQFALLVNGASGCNRWAEQPGIPQQIKVYAEQSL